MNGANLAGASGIYGTKGVAATSNMPGARYGAMSWTDTTGRLWMYGGLGYDAQGDVVGRLNDLWQYNPLSNQWTWVSGAISNSSLGVYGTQGTGASSNVPGARNSAASWTDNAGNLWLFGGNGYDANGNVAYLNDLWKYNLSGKQWVWLGGSSTINSSGTYGTQGIAAPGNIPSARYGAASWTDSAGNLWLFGGQSVTGPINGLMAVQPDQSTVDLGEWFKHG